VRSQNAQAFEDQACGLTGAELEPTRGKPSVQFSGSCGLKSRKKIGPSAMGSPSMLNRGCLSLKMLWSRFGRPGCAIGYGKAVALRIAHTAHHRAELATVLRILRREVYSIYGPSVDTGGLPENHALTIYIPMRTSSPLKRMNSFL